MFDLSDLDNPPQDIKINQALFNFKPFKVPGSDGLYPHFFQTQWTIVENLIKNLCHTVFNTQSLPNSINDTFLYFIPKFSNANHLKNFWLISLCSTTHKIIIKIIANRIKPSLSNLISTNHASFLKGHQTYDNVILI